MIIRPYGAYPREISKHMVSTTDNAPTWETVLDRMATLLRTLRSDVLRNRTALGELPERGIYVFYEHGKPVYVGRTNRIRQRILEHGSSNPTKAATFAYLLARRELTAKGVTPASISGKPASRITNADVEKHPSVIRLARKRISEMQFRVVEVTDAIEQTVFEVYAALQLKTTVQQGGYNDFENH